MASAYITSSSSETQAGGQRRLAKGAPVRVVKNRGASPVSFAYHRCMSIEQEPPLPEPDRVSQPMLWEFVRLADYRVPSPAGASAALEKWTSLRQLFRRDEQNQQDEQAPVKSEDELRLLSQSRLHGLARPIDWRGAAAALDAALADWLQASNADTAVRFVIGQPHCGHPEILAHWATRHDAIRIEAPSSEQILGDDSAWLEAWPAIDRLWVLANLEHCYLRHANGLGLVRRLLEQAASGALGRGVIACDSWAWAYLQEVWPLPQPGALTLQAFDGQRLSHFLAELMPCPVRDRLRFCNARTGNEVHLELGENNAAVSPEVNQLAIYSRGNIGCAWNSWRASLRATPDQGEDGTEQAGETQAGADPGAEIVWVSAVRQEPVLPAEKGEGLVFILHALLLHNGLPATLLPELLPQPGHRIASSVLQLQTQGVIALADGRWQISASAYAVVREFLRRRGFLRDNF